MCPTLAEYKRYQYQIVMVGRGGIEPPTRGSSVPLTSTTSELGVRDGVRPSACYPINHLVQAIAACLRLPREVSNSMKCPRTHFR